jgi:hypothetical protein
MNEAPVVEAPRLESGVTKEYTPVPAPSYGVFNGGDTSIPVRYVEGEDFCMQSSSRSGAGFSRV